MKMKTVALIGLAIGSCIAFTDNYAFEGEISPVVIVAFLFISAFSVVALFGNPGCIAAIGIWFCLPISHFIKIGLGLPDTLHPATFRSAVLLAVFTLIVVSIGSACGMVFRRLAYGAAKV